MTRQKTVDTATVCLSQSQHMILLTRQLTRSEGDMGGPPVELSAVGAESSLRSRESPGTGRSRGPHPTSNWRGCPRRKDLSPPRRLPSSPYGVGGLHNGGNLGPALT